MHRRTPEAIASVEVFKVLESKLPIFAQTRVRESEVLQDRPVIDGILPVYERIIRNNVRLDARMFLESLKRRELTRPEAEKVDRMVEAFLVRFLRGPASPNLY